MPCGRVQFYAGCLPVSALAGMLSSERDEWSSVRQYAVAPRHALVICHPAYNCTVSAHRCSTKVKYGEGSYASNDAVGFGLAATLQHPDGHTRTFSVRTQMWWDRQSASCAGHADNLSRSRTCKRHVHH